MSCEMFFYGLYVTNIFMNWENIQLKCSLCTTLNHVITCQGAQTDPHHIWNNLEKDSASFVTFWQPTYISPAVISWCKELHVAVVWWRHFVDTHTLTTPPCREMSVWKKYWIFNICRNPEFKQSTVCPLIGWTSGW